MTTTHSRAHFAARRAARAVAPWLVPLVLVLAWEFAARAGALSSR
ncbi:ABC transporter permease, partial [Burkholderia pseudomallei]